MIAKTARSSLTSMLTWRSVCGSSHLLSIVYWLTVPAQKRTKTIRRMVACPTISASVSRLSQASARCCWRRRMSWGWRRKVLALDALYLWSSKTRWTSLERVTPVCSRNWKRWRRRRNIWSVCSENKAEHCGLTTRRLVIQLWRRKRMKSGIWSAKNSINKPNLTKSPKRTFNWLSRIGAFRLSSSSLLSSHYLKVVAVSTASTLR